MPWENNTLVWVALVYCGVPLVGLFLILWFLKTIYGMIFGTAKSITGSITSVPRQAIQTAGHVHMVNAIVKGQLEACRLEHPEAHEKIVTTRVWAFYAIVGFILVAATVIFYFAGVIGGVALTVVDFGYFAYGFHLMDKARQGSNPRRIEQRDTKRLAAKRRAKIQQKGG